MNVQTVTLTQVPGEKLNVYSRIADGTYIYYSENIFNIY